MRSANLSGALLLLAAGCSAGAPAPGPPPQASQVELPSPGASVPAGSSAVAVSSAVAPVGEIVVVRARSAASRQPERPRTLRALIAAERGRIELAHGYQRVSLVVEAVVSGTLPDPDYAKRPVGVNHLPVVLLDEAAYAAPDGLDGFGGTWRLTRRQDGTLVARAIGDTPFPAARATERAKTLATTRAGLHAELPDDRVEALDALDAHFFYELVPDVIALLDDGRTETRPPRREGHHGIHLPRVVREVANERLRRLIAPLEDGERPPGASRKEWDVYWRAATSRPPPVLAPVVGSAPVELMRVAANQTWPEIVAVQPRKLALGVARMETPIDGFRAGIALVPAMSAAPREWIAGTTDAGFEPQGLSASDRGGALLFVGARSAWNLTIFARGRPPRPVSPTLPPKTEHAALAEDDRGFAILSGARGGSDLALTNLDPNGRAQGGAHRVAVQGQPELDYHHGIHPLAIASYAAGGWVVAADTSEGVSLSVLDATARSTVSTAVSMPGGLHEPVVAVRGPRIILAAKVDAGEARLSTTVFEGPGLAPRPSIEVGREVQRTSRVVTLSDGFAIAWIEADAEVHVARWDEDGHLLREAVLHRGEVAPFTLALLEDAGALVVGYQDTARYPYALRARRIALDQLR